MYDVSLIQSSNMSLVTKTCRSALAILIFLNGCGVSKDCRRCLFIASAGIVAMALGYLAHETFYVHRATIRENALVLAVLITALVIVGHFGDTSDNRK